jgi:hypothetical protein
MAWARGATASPAGAGGKRTPPPARSPIVSEPRKRKAAVGQSVGAFYAPKHLCLLAPPGRHLVYGGTSAGEARNCDWPAPAHLGRRRLSAAPEVKPERELKS